MGLLVSGDKFIQLIKHTKKNNDQTYLNYKTIFIKQRQLHRVFVS